MLKLKTNIARVYLERDNLLWNLAFVKYISLIFFHFKFSKILTTITIAF